MQNEGDRESLLVAGASASLVAMAAPADGLELRGEGSGVPADSPDAQDGDQGPRAA